MAASPALATTPQRTGRFFPGECTAAAKDFETFPATFPLHARYLPTRACLDAALARFGPRARPLLMAWLDIWRAAVGDVDAFAAAKKIDPLGPERPEDAPDYPDWPGPNFIRPASFHVLEDAQVLVGCLAAGLPFALRIGHRRSPPTFVPIPGLRRIRQESLMTWVKGRNAAPDGTYVDAREVFATSDKATPYWAMAAFTERAGRGMALARSQAEFVDVIMDMRAQGHAQAFVKGADSKSGTWVLDIPASGDVEELRAALAGMLGKGWANLARLGRPMPYLVQGMTPFVREHRFFVVSHRVVASTASDRMLGALDGRADRILDERVARLDVPAAAEGFYDRGGSRAEVDRRLVARMAWGARDLARAVGKDDRGLDCYVIDMGETADGRVLPVEINGMPRAGRYALDFGRVLRALRARADRAAGAGRLGMVARPRAAPLAGLVGRSAAREVRDAFEAGDFSGPLRERARKRRSSVPRDVVKPRGKDDPEGLKVPGSDLRRRLARHICRDALARLEKAAEHVGECLAPGSVTIHKQALGMGRTLADEIRSPGWSEGWESTDLACPEPLPGSWSISLTIQATEVDLAETLYRCARPGSHRRFIHPVPIVPALGAQARIDRVRGDACLRLPSGPDAGDEVAFGPEAMRPAVTRMDVSVLDKGELVAELSLLPGSAWDGFVRKGDRPSIQDILDTRGDPEAWARLGAELALKAVEAERADRDAKASGIVGHLSAVRGDSMGRILLTVAPAEGGSVLFHWPWRAVEGDYLVARIEDVDVRATALAICRTGTDSRIILRTGAATCRFRHEWPKDPIDGHFHNILDDLLSDLDMPEFVPQALTDDLT